MKLGVSCVRVYSVYSWGLQSNIDQFKWVKIASIYSSIHIYIATVCIYLVMNMGEMAMVWTEGEIHPETRQYSCTCAISVTLSTSVQICEHEAIFVISWNESADTLNCGVSESHFVDWETNFVVTVTVSSISQR